MQGYCSVVLFFSFQDLFIQYEWNNFLHSQVQRCISAILSSEIIPRCCDNKTSDSEDKRSCDGEVKENQLTQENNLLLQHVRLVCYSDSWREECWV